MEEKMKPNAPQGVNYFVELSEAFRGMLEGVLQLQGEIAAVARFCAAFRKVIETMYLKWGLMICDDRDSFPETGNANVLYVSRAGGVYLWDEEKGYHTV